MNLSRLLIASLLMLFSIVDYGQRPDLLPEDTVITADMATYTQELKGGIPTPRKMLFQYQKYFFAANIIPTPIGYTPPATGNWSIRVQYVEDPIGDIYYIDGGGRSLLIRDASNIDRIFVDSQTITGGGTGNDTLKVDTTFVSTLTTLADTAAAIRSDLAGGSSPFTLTVDTIHVDSDKKLRIGGSLMPISTGFFSIEDRLLFMDNGFSGQKNYFFGNIAAWSAAHGGNPYNTSNNFHFWGTTTSDMRAEYENDTGPFQLYIEGIDEAWYGWQNGATHLWSNGYETAVNGTKLVWSPSFGLNSYVTSLSTTGDFYSVKGHFGTENQGSYILSALGSGAGLIGRFENTNTSGRGLLLKGGATGTQDLLKIQNTTSGLSIFEVNAAGQMALDGPTSVVIWKPGVSLDLQATNKAFLMNRLNTTQRDAIPSPVEGMLIWNNGPNQFEYHNGTAWGPLRNEQYWSLVGSDPELVGFGSTLSNLHTFTSNFKGARLTNDTEETYLQVAASSAGSVTSGLMLTAVENSVSNHTWTFNNRGATRDYDLTIAYTQTVASGLNPVVGGTGNVEALTIEKNGEIGIGTIDPTQKLHVSGSVRIEDDIYDENNSPGVPGQVLSTTATGIDWVDAGLLSIPDSITLFDEPDNLYLDVTHDLRDNSFSFNSDGVDSVFVLNGGTGRVGIGTNDPLRILSVKSSDNDLLYLESTDALATIALVDVNTTNDVVLQRIGNNTLINPQGGKTGFAGVSNPSAAVEIQPEINSESALIINAISSQSADVFQSKASNGDIDVAIDSDGILIANNGVSFTGWADYVDTTFTETSTLALSDGVKITLPNNAEVIRDMEIPMDLDSMYNRADSTIMGVDGDGLAITIEFKVKPTTGADTRIFTAIDIGGSVGEIYPRDFVLSKGNGVTHYFLSSFTAYTLNTWETNGGKVKIEAIGGTAEVWDIRFVLTRTHKARG